MAGRWELEKERGEKKKNSARDWLWSIEFATRDMYRAPLTDSFQVDSLSVFRQGAEVTVRCRRSQDDETISIGLLPAADARTVVVEGAHDGLPVDFRVIRDGDAGDTPRLRLLIASRPVFDVSGEGERDRYTPDIIVRYFTERPFWAPEVVFTVSPAPEHPRTTSPTPATEEVGLIRSSAYEADTRRWIETVGLTARLTVRARIQCGDTNKPIDVSRDLTLVSGSQNVSVPPAAQHVERRARKALSSMARASSIEGERVESSLSLAPSTDQAAFDGSGAARSMISTTTGSAPGPSSTTRPLRSIRSRRAVSSSTLRTRRRPTRAPPWATSSSRPVTCPLEQTSRQWPRATPAARTCLPVARASRGLTTKATKSTS